MEKELGDKDNLAEIMRMIGEDVNDYWDCYKRPVPAGRLHKRCARRMKYTNLTMVEILRRMQESGRVRLVIAERLSRFCFPMDAWKSMSDMERLDQLNQINGVSAGDTMNEEIDKDGELPAGDYFDG